MAFSRNSTASTNRSTRGRVLVISPRCRSNEALSLPEVLGSAQIPRTSGFYSPGYSFTRTRSRPEQVPPRRVGALRGVVLWGVSPGAERNQARSSATERNHQVVDQHD